MTCFLESHWRSVLITNGWRVPQNMKQHNSEMSPPFHLLACAATLTINASKYQTLQILAKRWNLEGATYICNWLRSSVQSLADTWQCVKRLFSFPAVCCFRGYFVIVTMTQCLSCGRDEVVGTTMQSYIAATAAKWSREGGMPCWQHPSTCIFCTPLALAPPQTFWGERKGLFESRGVCLRGDVSVQGPMWPYACVTILLFSKVCVRELVSSTCFLHQLDNTCSIWENLFFADKDAGRGLLLCGSL